MDGSLSGSATTAGPGRTARGLAALLVADGVSMLGTRMTLLAVPWFVLVTTGSATRTGLVAFVETLPYVGVQAAGGPLVDRFGPRRTSVQADLLATLVFGAVPVLHAVHHLTLPTLAVLIGVGGALRSASATARTVLVPVVTVAAGAPLERGAGLHDGVNRLAGLLGAPLAGALLAVWSGPTVLALDAATFAVAAVLVGTLVPHARPVGDDDEPAGAGGPRRETYLASLRRGLAFLRGDRLLLAIGLTVLATNLLDQAYSSVLAPVWVRQVTGSPVTLGLLSAVFGTGAVLGTAVLSWVGPRLPRHRTFVWCFLLGGAPRFLALATLSTVSPVLAVSFGAGLGAGALNPLLGAAQYERIPEALQARVLGAVNALAWAGIPLGSLLGGLSVSHLGLRATLLVAGTVYLAVTVLPFALPAWKDMDRVPDAAPSGS